MYRVFIDELVFLADFKRIDKPDQQMLIKTIRKKLTTEPAQYGNPLKGNLKGFWKLKVGHYRVIYQIKKAEVIVYVSKIGFRRDEEVYKEILKRIKG